jgi:hypothetical protein
VLPPSSILIGCFLFFRNEDAAAFYPLPIHIQSGPSLLCAITSVCGGSERAKPSIRGLPKAAELEPGEALGRQRGAGSPRAQERELGDGRDVTPNVIKIH